AATCGHLEMVQLLIEAGANVNIYSDSTNHPLLWAIFEGHQDIVEYLVPLTNPKQQQEIERTLFNFFTSQNRVKID
ncbi:MAG: ankyrin repeat domain-containing protein, partial [Xenococcaceae cyanobacterium]